MRLLLDTHTYLWATQNSARLPASVRASLEAAAAVYVSAASAWEVAIKAALGRLELVAPVAQGVALSGFLPLSVSLQHADSVAGLPRIHGDPFDRLLVAQARLEGLTIVTSDPVIPRYGVPVLWT